MYRVNIMSGTVYALEMDFDNSTHMNEVYNLFNEGDPVILVQDLDDLDNIGFDPDDVQIVERDE